MLENQSPKESPVQERLKSLKENIQVTYGSGPDVQRSKRPLATPVRNVQWKPPGFGKKVKVGNKVQFGNRVTSQ